MEVWHSRSFQPAASVPSCTGETGELKAFPRLPSSLSSGYKIRVWEVDDLPEISKAKIRQKPSPCYFGLFSVGGEGGGDANVQSPELWVLERAYSSGDSQTQRAFLNTSSLAVKRQLREVVNFSEFPSSQLPDPSCSGSGLQCILELPGHCGPPDCGKNSIFLGGSFTGVLDIIPGGPAKTLHL